MENYVTVDKISVGEYSEKHSRFIATLYPCDSKDKVAEILKEHRQKYWDARHNVYAFVLKDNTSGFSDDGEPHGTAAKPVLDILSFSGITDALVVVTRYFGGILLGTGGLVRAYSASAKAAVDSAERLLMTECDTFSIKMPYSDQGKITNLIMQFDGIIEKTDFADDVTLDFAIDTESTESFNKKLCEITSAKIKAEFKSKKILPKPTKK